ncbi:DNRLRE domain-containing protein [Streptosporangium sp. NPDC049046]|uniref:DNRLRE domain-containing protein n=1 Tax=Streptosporangium sp. NPDC049046 TaxID=3155031 RepID=UPI00344AFA8B
MAAAVLGAGTHSDGSKARAYLKFDMSSLVGQQISNVTLSLLNIDGPSCGTTVGDGIQVRRVTSAWSPSTVTWSMQPTNTTENAVTNTSSIRSGSCNPAPMNWDITAMARQWAGDVGNYGLVLMSPTERASNNYRVFPASEDTDFNNPPKITAIFDPIGGPTVLYPAGPDGVEVIQTPANWRSDALQMAEPLAHALSGAHDRVEANSGALATPYADMVTGQVIVPAATTDGRAIGSAALTGTAYLDLRGTDWTVPGTYEGDDTNEDSEVPVGEAEDYTFAPQVPDVTRSSAQLSTIVSEILEADTSQVPGADRIVSASVWPEHNQVLLTANTVSTEMRLALAQRYGTNTVVIRLDPNAVHAQRQDSRLNDNDGYINGAGAYLTDQSRPCTMGFAWSLPAGKRLITAGHCLDNYTAGIFSYGRRVLGTHLYGEGTVPIPGQSALLGDSALIEVTKPGIQPTASIFVGSVNSTSKRSVKGSFHRRSGLGDLYCVGGMKTGQTCNWKVTDPNTGIRVNDGRIENVIKGTHPSACTDSGDSGGAVYIIDRTSGYVVAKGIHSSANTPLIGDCDEFFTDINSVRQAYGGDVMKRKLPS